MFLAWFYGQLDVRPSLELHASFKKEVFYEVANAQITLAHAFTVVVSVAKVKVTPPASLGPSDHMKPHSG